MKDRGKVRLLAQKDQTEEGRRQLRELRPVCRPLIDVIGHCAYLMAYKAQLAASGNLDLFPDGQREAEELLPALQFMVEAAWDHGMQDALDGRDPDPPPDLSPAELLKE